MWDEASFSSDTDTVTESEYDTVIEDEVNDPPPRKLGFGDPEYWDQRYSNDSSSFEWYASWTRLKPYLGSILAHCNSALYVGCGTSTLGCDILETGVKKVVNIDISKTVITAMQERYPPSEQLEWLTCDIRKTKFRPETFDVIIDKGTMDAMMCSDISSKTVFSVFDEVSRLLKAGGHFIVVSSGAPELRESYFSHDSFDWTLHEALKVPKLPIKGSYYYVYIAEKNAKKQD